MTPDIDRSVRNLALVGTNHFAWYTMFVSIGQFLGPLVGELIIQVNGPMSAFPVAGTVSLICIAAAMLTSRARPVEPSIKAAGRTRIALGYGTQLRLLRSNPAVQVSLIITVAIMFAIAAHSAFFPVYLEAMAVPASVIGVLLSLRALSSTTVRVFMTRVIELIGGRLRTLILSVALAAMGLMVTGMTATWWLLGTLAIMIGVGFALPLAMVTIADHVPREDRPATAARMTRRSATRAAACPIPADPRSSTSAW